MSALHDQIRSGVIDATPFLQAYIARGGVDHGVENDVQSFNAYIYGISEDEIAKTVAAFRDRNADGASNDD